MTTPPPPSSPIDYFLITPPASTAYDTANERKGQCQETVLFLSPPS